MNERYIKKEVFNTEIRRIDRQGLWTTTRLEAKMNAGHFRIDKRIEKLTQEIHDQKQSQQAYTDKGFAEVSLKISEVHGEVREIRGELSGIRESIDSFKHVMTMGFTILGLLITIAIFFAK